MNTYITSNINISIITNISKYIDQQQIKTENAQGSEENSKTEEKE